MFETIAERWEYINLLYMITTGVGIICWILVYMVFIKKDVDEAIRKNRLKRQNALSGK